MPKERNLFTIQAFTGFLFAVILRLISDFISKDEIPDFMSKANISVSVINSEPKELKELIDATAKLWRKYHLTYDQAGYVAKEVRHSLCIKRVKTG